MAAGTTFEQLPTGIQDAWLAWSNAPGLGSLKLVADIPALLIVLLITVIGSVIYFSYGKKHSKLEA